MYELRLAGAVSNLASKALVLPAACVEIVPFLMVVPVAPTELGSP